MSEKVKDFQNPPFLVYMKTKKKNLLWPLHQTVELLILQILNTHNIYPLMVLKAAYFRSNPKHTEKQLLKVSLSTELIICKQKSL